MSPLTETVRASTDLMRLLATCPPGIEELAVDAGLARARPGNSRHWRAIAPGLPADARPAAKAVSSLVAGFDGSAYSVGATSMEHLRRELFACVGIAWRRMFIGFGNSNGLISKQHESALKTLAQLAAKGWSEAPPHLAVTLELLDAMLGRGDSPYVVAVDGIRCLSAEALAALPELLEAVSHGAGGLVPRRLGSSCYPGNIPNFQRVRNVELLNEVTAEQMRRVIVNHQTSAPVIPGAVLPRRRAKGV